MHVIENLKWRYATKKFDKDKKVSESDFRKLQEVIQLTATSFGLQFYKVLNVTDPEVREQLQKVSFGQPQITEASHLLVFGHYSDISDKDVDEFIEFIAQERDLKVDMLQDYSQMMKGYINSRPDKYAWAARQTYLVLGTLMMAAAEMKIDTCPIEGFDENQYDKILGMKEKGLKTAVTVALGYRSKDDEYQHATKVRRPMEDLFLEI